MSQKYRVGAGRLVDSSQPMTFWFNGRRFTGWQGDTLASALLANGVHLVGRSFKYHRPRGIYTCGIEEPNALVQILSEENSAQRMIWLIVLVNVEELVSAVLICMVIQPHTKTLPIHANIDA